ncbi:hypothetical protein ACFPQ7_03035 [Methylobacterium iners]|uniref:hypothetical protein n=1 Tax=Methylobacterium iners TaxID=418707 RepID=UPI003613949E
MRDEVESECVGHNGIRKEARSCCPPSQRTRSPKDGERQAFTMLVRNETKVTACAAILISRIFDSARTSRRSRCCQRRTLLSDFGLPPLAR